jgi:hypothetical protein
VYVSKKRNEVPQPPEPPEVKRAINLYPYQWIGIPLMLLIPILAVFGVFGDRYNRVTQTGNGLEIEINYGTHLRYKTLNPLEISVRNMGGETLERLVVSIDRDYIENFTNVQFKPDVARLNDKFYEVEFENMPAGDTRVVTVELQGERPGQHSGTITASTGGGAVQTSIETFVFP